MGAASVRDEARPLRPEDGPALAGTWAVAHPDDEACAGGLGAGAPPPAERGVAIARAGEIVAAATLREWGRVAQVHALGVRPEHRRQGLGGRLLAALVDDVQRADLAVVGVELPADDPAAATLLGLHGFRPQPPTWVLERAVEPVGEPAAEGADEPAGEHAGEGAVEPIGEPGVEAAGEAGGAEAGGDAPAAPAAARSEPRPDGWRLLASEPSADDLALVGALAACLDADLDPVPWLRGLLASGAAEALWCDEAPGALAVLPAGPGAALRASMVLVDESAPFPRLRRLVDALHALAAARGRSRLVLPGPTRSWSAVEALLGQGFRPVASRPRFTLRGHPDRSDLRRVALASWR